MSIKRLILILVAVLGLLLPAKASATDALPIRTAGSVSQTDERPQWSDLGMEHILAVSGQSNITPPSPVRLVSQGRRLAGGNSHYASDHPEAVSQMCGLLFDVQFSAQFRPLWMRGYIYIIQCLRL